MSNLEKLIPKLNKQLKNLENTNNTKHLKHLFEKRDKKALQIVFSNNNLILDELNHIFTHWKDGEKHQSTIDVIKTTNNYSVLRSEMWSEKRAKNGEGTYHAAWIIGKTNNNFYIHRMKWIQQLEKPNPVIPNSHVEKELNGELMKKVETTSFMKLNHPYILHQNLTITKIHTDKQYEDVSKNKVLNSVKDEEIYSALNKYVNNLTNRLGTSPNVKIDTFNKQVKVFIDADTTEELKQVQKELSIPEKQVRSKQNHKDIDALQPHQRSKIIKEIVRERANNYAKNTLKQKLNQSTTNTLSRLNKKIGKHELSITYSEPIEQGTNFLKFVCGKNSTITITVNDNDIDIPVSSGAYLIKTLPNV